MEYVDGPGIKLTFRTASPSPMATVYAKLRYDNV
jgi:hypothetical protein